MNDDLCLIADLSPSQTCTIPTECAVTSIHLDIPIIIDHSKELHIIELTVPFDLHADDAHKRKSNKYAPLVSDITKKGFKVSFYTIEIGSRGFINDRIKKQLKVIHILFNIKEYFKMFLRKLSKISVISSFVIYHAKKESTWTPHSVLFI